MVARTSVITEAKLWLSKGKAQRRTSRFSDAQKLEIIARRKAGEEFAKIAMDFPFVRLSAVQSVWYEARKRGEIET